MTGLVALGGGLALGLSAQTTSGGSGSAQPQAETAVALQADFTHVVRTARRSVVEIGTRSSLGSGVVYDDKGDIVTNSHVVGTARAFVVTLSNGQRFRAALVGSYPPEDLAVIRVSTPERLTPAVFDDSSNAEVGNIVLAIGSPLGLSSSVTDGIVSFNGRSVTEENGVVLSNLIQTSAPINPGNSGGALVDLRGDVVGIPTLGAAAASGSAAAGLGFAIPSNTVKMIAGELIAQGKVTATGRAALGVTGATAFDAAGDPIGVAVTSVTPGGVAEEAGIVVGDRITQIDGHPTPQLADLLRVLSGLTAKSRALLVVTAANGVTHQVSLELGDLADS
jgi:S1-C subfamily serine protease